jgi:class 3 adenylate cyclase
VTRCPACGSENRAGARFCDSCGARLAPTDLEQRRKPATLVFCDVTGSTALGERLDAEAVRELMFSFYDEMRAAIERHGGTVEKFVGDAVMAVFGVPEAHEDDPLRALRAAAEMRERIVPLNARLDRLYGSQLRFRIGVNSGEVVAGDPSTRETFVSGDAVNVAARLEQAAAPGEILLGETTYRLARHAIDAEPVEPVRAKGKSEPVRAYRLLAVTSADERATSQTPLVGRESELDALDLLFARSVEEERLVLTTILGEAGVGKTRLATELVARLADRARVHVGRCLPYGEGITYWPLAEIVRDAASIGAGHDRAEALARVDALGLDAAAGTTIASLVGLSDEPVAAEQVPWAVRSLVETLSDGRPLVLLVENLHWAEPALLDLLLDLPARTRAPVLVLATARAELREARPHWPVAVELDVLDATATHALVEATGLSAEDQDAVVRASGGNPLFAEELAAFLAERPEVESVPPTLGALLAARLDALRASERAAAERGAIEGELFHGQAVTALSPPADRADVASALAALAERDLVRRAPAHFDADVAFRFKHALVRDAAYAGISKRARALLHERFHEWLRERVGERLPEVEEIVGYHLEQAVRYLDDLGPRDPHSDGLAAAASGYLASAGRRALGRGDASAAANLLERALALAAGEAAQLELSLDLGEALRDAGRLAHANETLVAAIARATESGDARVEWRARVEHAFLQRYTNPEYRVDELLAVADQATRVFDQAGDETGLIRAWRLAGEAHWSRCRIGAMGQAFERAHAHAERADERRELRTIRRGLLRAALAGSTPVDEAIPFCNELRDSSLADPVTRAVASLTIAVMEAMRGRFDDARATAADGIALAEELGAPLLAAALRAWAAEVELLAGAADAAERLLAPALETLRSLEETGILASVAAYRAEALWLLDRHDEAEQLTVLSERNATRDDLHAQVAWRVTRARIGLARGELDVAAALAGEAVELAQETDYLDLLGKALAAVGETHAAAGRAEQSARALADALAAFEAKGNIVAATAVRSSLGATVS